MSLEMVATNKDYIKNWHEFEAASTYEYAQEQVKALRNASKE